MRPFAPAQGQPMQRAQPMIGGGMRPMGGAAPMRAQVAQPMEPRSASVPGGMMGGRGAQGAGPTSGAAGQIGGMFGGAGVGGIPRGGMGLMSDERSKTKIRELEGIKQRYMALLDGPDEKRRMMADLDDAGREGTDYLGEDDHHAFGTPLRKQAEYPSESELRSGGESLNGFARVGAHESSYKPEFQDKPGAGRGRFAGPMTSELKGIPGVVKEGPGGMEQVDTPRLTMANASQLGNLTREGAITRAEIDALRERLGALSDDPDATLDVAGGRRR